MTTTKRLLHEVIDRLSKAESMAVPVDFTGRPDLATIALHLAREAKLDFDDLRDPGRLSEAAWQRISDAVTRMADQEYR